MSTPLTPHERDALLDLAIRAVRAAVNGEPPPRLADPATGALAAPGGAFASIHTREGELRGCIGSLRAMRPLWQAVVDAATAAATRDGRFPAVEVEELGRLNLEVSVLTAPEPIRGPEEVRVGVDGLVLESGGGSGLLLPQVAREHGWNAEQFLDALTQKAGVSRDTWRGKRAGVRLSRFQAEVFSRDF
ncbi:MAG: AmmeMemoRadiSam system protein A [Planctomycetes bacterium]|nr:AmmeMemoRadiSam system protein A [Planctomycetota bacterium]